MELYPESAMLIDLWLPGIATFFLDSEWHLGN